MSSLLDSNGALPSGFRRGTGSRIVIVDLVVIAGVASRSAIPCC